MAQSQEHRKQAIVIGGSLAGLLAARVLSEHFSDVLVLERDDQPSGPGPRRGVPQGRHVHVLLRSGELVLERLFPGFGAALEARGAHALDFAADIRWYHHGVWKQRFQSDFPMHTQTRPLLDGLVRERVQSIPNVRFRWESSVAGLILEGGRVTGVRLRDAGSPEPWDEEAAVVVDASGRGSQLDRWLQAHGAGVPREDRIGIDLLYASRLYRRPPGERDWKGLAVYPEPPFGKRAGIIFPVEDGGWMVTLFGWLGDHPSDAPEGFTRFARSLTQPDLSKAIEGAEPLSEIKLHRFPYARWRHYEDLPRFPAGLVPLGDSVCSFDPVFGQGMSVAAKGAALLQTHLAADPRLEQPRRFLKALARTIGTPWLLAGSEDLRFPQTEGARPAGLSLLQSYTRHVLKLTGSSPAVYAQFLRVLNLVAEPPVLFRPDVLVPVLGRVIARA